MILLMNLWKKNGQIEQNSQLICDLLRINEAQWEEINPAISSFFYVQNGSLRHLWIDVELKKVHATCQKRSKAGRASAASKKAHRTTSQTASFVVESTSIVSPLLVESVTAKMTKQAVEIVQVEPASIPKEPEKIIPSIILPIMPALIHMVVQPVNQHPHEDESQHTPPQSPSVDAATGQEISPGLVCKRLKSHLITGVNPGNMNLIDLVNRGAGMHIFEEAASICAQKQCYSFPYVLRTAENFFNEEERSMRNDSLPLPDGFDKFWSAFPKKEGKTAAISAYRLGKCAAVLPAILMHIESRKQTDSWLQQDGKYVPNAANFLREKRWLDEISGGSDINWMIKASLNQANAEPVLKEKPRSLNFFDFSKLNKKQPSQAVSA